MRRRLPLFSHRLRHLLLSNPTNPLRPISLFPILHPPHSSPRPFSSSTHSRDDGVSLCCQMWIDNFRHPDRAVTSISPLLRRFDLWVLAYQKVATDDTGSYTPRSSLSTSTLQDLLALRNAVLDGKFKWGARLKFFLKSPRDKTDYDSLSKRKIKTILTTTQPSPFQDKIVQEVLLMVLEPIYEPRFSPKSYAFRPGRTPHTVLRVIRRSFAGYLWYIKGDFSVLLDGMKVGMVVNAVMRDVRDKLIVDLIKDALVTPVVVTTLEKKEKKKKRKYQKKRVLAEDEPKPDPYWLDTFFGFAPEEANMVPNWGHCGVLSPLLANVCLDELDRWMEGKIKEFYVPSKSDVIWNNPEEEQGNTSWPEFVPTSGPDKTRKMDFVRYGGHILIGVRGPRADAAALRKQLIEFCDQRFMLKLDNESLPIEHITKGIMFLDHVLCRRVVYPTLRYTATGGKIISEKGVGTLLSVTASLKQCIKQFRKLSFLKGDKDPDPQPCFRMFHATQAHTNAQMNKFLSTMVEWYRYADNRKKIVNFCSYIIRGSLAKLYAAKYKLRSRAKVYKIGARNLSRPLKEKKGQSPEYQNLLRMGLAESIDGLHYTRMSLVPETDYSLFPSDWRPDHEKLLLEYIKLEDPKTLEEQRSCITEQGLVTPQDYISMLVWNYKRNSIAMDQRDTPLYRPSTTAEMFARRAVSTVARRAVVARPVAPVRSFASSVRRFDSGTHGDPKPGEPSKHVKPFDQITSEADLLPEGAKPGTMPTDLEQATGLERLEILGKMQGVDIFDMSPLDASRKGTLDNPITVKSFGDEQYVGCTGYPADSHVVIWLTTSRDRPVERCPECGSVYKMEYVGPQDSHDDHHHHDIHDSSDGSHNYEAEPQTMADFIRPEYR